MSDKVSWEELEPLASGWGCVWDNADKLQWAKEAWGIITDAGLATYSSPVDRARVVMRFMALAGIFSDFYEIAFLDGFKPEYLHIARELDVTDFQLGQLAGEDGDEDDLHSLVLEFSAKSRAEVYKALVTGFGHLPALFISLWKTNPSLADYRDDEDDDNDIANRNLTPEKSQVYEWLTEGCYPWG
jgi:hypothetical protein